MAETFRFYKGTEKVAEGATPLAITKVAANTDVKAGDYKASRVIDGDESPKVDVPAFKTLPVSVTGVTLDKTELSVEVGKTAKLTPTVAPTNATNKKVSYASDKPEFVTVAGDGTVTGVAAGSAVVTVTTEDGKKTATANITTTAPAEG